MKKYTSLFALLIIMTLLIIETVPLVRVSAESLKCGDRGQPPCPPPANPGNPSNSGGPEKPGPKNRKPTPVPPTPTLVVPPTATPTLVLPYPYPYPLPYPYSGSSIITPTPVPFVIPNIQGQNACKFGPCWLFNLLSGDPVELLAIGGFIVFVIVIAFVFFRGRMNSGGK
jgi:hypothetical protein